MSTSNSRRLTGYLLSAVGHLCGTTIVGAMIGVAVLDWSPAVALAGKLVGIAEIREASTPELLLFGGLSACVWAMLVIGFQLVSLHLKEREKRTVNLSRGTVVTETLIVLPIFLLLTFGLAQLAVSGLAGILMNVAGYQAARSAWVWQPEEDVSNRRMGVEDGVAAEKCKIAVALVMTPVAPGNFISDPRMGTDMAEQMRVAAGGAHVPFAGTLAAEFPEAASLLATVGSIDPTIATRNNQSMARALDFDSFVVRTLKKFTHAYHASGCTINDDHSVTATYLLHIAMPMMGPVFGERHAPNTSIGDIISDGGFGDVDGVGLRWGYYAPYTRDFGFEKQRMTPNATLPSNNQSRAEPSNDRDAEGEIGGAVGL